MGSDMTNETYWGEEWQRRLQSYLSGPPRLGRLIEHRLGDQVTTTLELGAGSSRDTIYLASAGYRCVASDFSEATMAEVSARFASERLRFSVDDSRSLGFADDEFDLVFHNGLLVCFESDDDIRRILQEQHRVASRYMMIVVHNAENPGLVAEYARLGQTESLYQIRFFSRVDIQDALTAAGVGYQGIQFLKCGGPTDLLYAERLKSIPNPLHRWAGSLAPRAYSLQPWSRTERIACLVEL